MAYFKFTVLFVFVGYILQILQNEIIQIFRTKNYSENTYKFYEFLNENLLYYSGYVVSGVLIWLIVFLIFYLNKNKVGKQQ